MSRMPEQKSLPMNMKLPICEGCLQRGGELQYMGLIVGRDFAQDYGMYWHECDRCGRVVGPYQCPLYWLSATNLEELQQVMAFDKAGGKVTAISLGDLSPPARQILERFGTNPFALAEAAAELALKRGQAEAKVKELEQRLDDTGL